MESYHGKYSFAMPTCEVSAHISDPEHFSQKGNTI